MLFFAFLGYLLGVGINLFVCVLIAKFFIKTRRFNFEWAVFFLFFGSIPLGSLILYVSSTNAQVKKMPSKATSFYVALSLFILSVLALIRVFISTTMDFYFFEFLMASIFLFGASVFWDNKFREAQGKSIYSLKQAAGLFACILLIGLAIYAYVTLYNRYF